MSVHRMPVAVLGLGLVLINPEAFASSAPTATCTAASASALAVAELGSVSSGTMRDRDLLSSFSGVLKDLRGEEEAEKVEAYNTAIELLEKEEDDWTDDDINAAAEAVSTLMDKLDEHAPEGAYFGAHPGDGADYGFFLA